MADSSKEETDDSTKEFTGDDEAKEKKSMTASQKSEANSDLYGQVHPKETPELISKSLADLDKELEKIPTAEKVGWSKAKEQCPDLADEKHRLLFLRCEVFNIDLAALRLVKYWDKRVELFGESKAFLPLTLDGALREDALALSICHMLLPGTFDENGRAIIFADPSRLRPELGYTRTSLIRAIWYTAHAALESESAQKRGVIFLVFPKYIKLRDFDRKLAAMSASSIRGLLPLRIGAFHICQPPAFVAKFLFPVIKFLLGARLRARLKVHYGTEKKVLSLLSTYGISKDIIPTELGGSIVLNQEKWLEDRKAAGK